MKKLREYAQLSNWQPSFGDQLRLYELALAGVNRYEARIILALSMNHFNVIYKKLKDNLIEGFPANPQNYPSNILKLRHSIRRQYTSAKLLMQLEKKAAGIPLARETLKKAEKHGMFQIALDLCRDLRNYYGPTDPNKKLYEYYTQKQRFIMQETIYELEAEDFFFDLSYSLKRGLPLIDFEEKLKQLSKIKTDSYNFHYMCKLSEVIYLQINGKEKEMIEACSLSLQFFERYKNLPYVVKFSFYYRAIAVHVSRKEFKQAELIISRCLKDTAVGEHNWHIVMFYKVLLYFHMGEMALAFDIWNKANKTPKKQQTKEIQERWLIVEAYLALMEIELPNKFRLNRFLNSIPLVNADKSDQNVSVIIFELMYLLKEGKLDQFGDRCNQLDRYIHHYLKGKNLNRSINFLRLLQCIHRGGYRCVAVRRKAQIYLPIFEKTTPNISSNAVEIIPFEMLWEMAIGWL